MFARVLFPTDFSAYANAVFACLPDLKPAGMGQVVLLNVIRSGDVPWLEVNQEALDRVRWSVEEQLNVARMALEGEGLRVVTRVEYGSPAATIVRVAEEERVELIFLGAQGRTLAQEVLLGSVAYEVVRRASVPVLLYKFEVVRELGHIECRRICRQMFQRVLHPTDFSECAEEAFQVVKQLGEAGTREVVLLHVQDERIMRHRPAEQVAEFDREDVARLEAMCRTLRVFGLQARYLLRHGIPYRETLRVAEEVDPCLIVLGSLGRSAVREILAGSTLENVIRFCRQPALIIRWKGKERPAA